jgi:membrane protein DedA with SNARE-associated domain
MSIFDLFDFAVEIIAKLGYFGVFLGTFLEGVFPPIPSEILMGFSGFLIGQGRFQWIPTIIVASLGNIASVSLIWFVGKTLGRDFILKWGKYIGVTAKEIESGEKMFAKYGYWAVFLLQMVPLARTLIAFPAGTLKTVYWKFIIVNTLGATAWLTFLLYLGYTFGENWEKIEDFMKPFERGILALAAVFFIFLGVKFFLHIKKQREEGAGSKISIE